MTVMFLFENRVEFIVDETKLQSLFLFLLWENSTYRDNRYVWCSYFFIPQFMIVSFITLLQIPMLSYFCHWIVVRRYNDSNIFEHFKRMMREEKNLESVRGGIEREKLAVDRGDEYLEEQVQ